MMRNYMPFSFDLRRMGGSKQKTLAVLAGCCAASPVKRLTDFGCFYF